MNTQNATEVMQELTKIRNEIDILIDFVNESELPISEEVAQRVATYQSEGKCLKCDDDILDGEKVTRNCHKRCAEKLRRLIKAGSTTWSECILAGRCTVAGPPGPRSDSDEKPYDKKAITDYEEKVETNTNKKREG